MSCADALTGDLGTSHPRYRQFKKLAAGAFGAVLLAEDRHSSGGLVALKCISKSSVSSNGYAEAEVLNHMRLRHPHVVTLREVFLTEEHVVLALEYAAGGDLAQRVPPGQGIPEDQGRWLFQQLLFALEYCHRMGIASRDVKLENVLLDSASPFPIAKLADFGLSTECDARGHVSHCGAVGTPMYFAPELLEKQPPGATYDAKAADIWSAGVLLFCLLTGTSPFQRVSDAPLDRSGKMQAMLGRIGRLDYHLPQRLSPEARDLIARMLSPDPASRPTAAEVLAHPWCACTMPAATVLACNDSFVAKCAAAPPSPQLVEEVRSILREAALAPITPRARPSKARRVAGSSSDEGSSPASGSGPCSQCSTPLAQQRPATAQLPL